MGAAIALACALSTLLIQITAKHTHLDTVKSQQELNGIFQQPKWLQILQQSSVFPCRKISTCVACNIGNVGVRKDQVQQDQASLEPCQDGGLMKFIGVTQLMSFDSLSPEAMFIDSVNYGSKSYANRTESYANRTESYFIGLGQS
ncbi:hypothetical protein B0H14DRAFT_2641604 [Mycena olivaceomarginata]|nr:hypothetical protein B0H14DRAFT_2641604 [Mycena olivaceomarginata]